MLDLLQTPSDKQGLLLLLGQTRAGHVAKNDEVTVVNAVLHQSATVLCPEQPHIPHIILDLKKVIKEIMPAVERRQLVSAG